MSWPFRRHWIWRWLRIIKSPRTVKYLLCFGVICICIPCFLFVSHPLTNKLTFTSTWQIYLKKKDNTKCPVFEYYMVVIPWSPTMMTLMQRCRFICFRPFISWPMMLSISLRGLSSYKQEKAGLKKEINPKCSDVLNWNCFHTFSSFTVTFRPSGLTLTSLLSGPSRCPKVSGCSECTA